MPPFLMPAVFALGWWLFPSILRDDSVHAITLVVTIAWGFEFFLYRKVWDFSALPGLTSREQEKLSLKLKEVRRRIWITGAGCLACVSGAWLLTALHDPLPLGSAVVMGLLAGLSMSSIALVAMWFDETSSFVDEIRLRESNQKKRAEYAKAMAAFAKDGKS